MGCGCVKFAVHDVEIAAGDKQAKYVRCRESVDDEEEKVGWNDGWGVAR
jgi:hypothetical protein